MKLELNASLMCADFGRLASEIHLLEEAGIDSFHIDIMDGRFVDNFAMSLCDLSFIAKAAAKPLDVHLMIEHPRVHIEKFLKLIRPGDTVYIHAESEYHPSTTLNRIIEAGMVPGVAINPCTSIESVKEIACIAKKVMVMMVDPGEAGRPYLPFVSDKIKRLVDLKESLGIKIYLDGACNDARILSYARLGVDGFVLGTNALFNGNRDYMNKMENLRNLAGL